jgi:hypothetical protein
MNETRPSRIRTLGVVFFVIALLATLLGAFHLLENWRGERKWEGYRKKLTADGANLDLNAFIPPAIPDQQNFAATPFFTELFPGPKATNWNAKYWPETFFRINPQSSPGKRNERALTDLVAWQHALRGSTNDARKTGAEARASAARELLTALQPYEPTLAELRSVAARPLSRFDVHYTMDNPWGIRLPHLPVLKQLAQLLSVKACAELAADNPDRALEDVRLLDRVVHSMDQELFLINYLVEVAAFQPMLQPIWEGMVLGIWSDAQLEELQQMLLGFNFVQQLERPLKTERAAGILTLDLLMKQRYKFEFLDALTGQQGSKFRNAASLLIPKGWFRLEQYEYTKLANEFVLPGADGTNRLVHPSLIERNNARLQSEVSFGWHGLMKHRLLAALLLPAVVKVHRKAAEAQTGAQQGAIACALERYRRKRGEYPDELTQLAPEFMANVPHDVIGGKPMRYKRGKQFVLYSVGWDEKDNGGTPGKVLWDEQGDWVWTYSQ